MSSFDDDLSEMSAAAGIHSDGSIAGNSQGSGEFSDPSPLVTQFLTDLRALGDGPAPPPSDELAALFSGASSLTAARHGRSVFARHKVGLVIAAAAMSTAALTGVAAAHDRLPQPAQTVVARVVNDLTPFHVDPSHGHVPPATHPSGPAATPTHTEPSEPAESEPAGSAPGESEPSESEAATPAQQTEPGDGQASAAPGGEDATAPAAPGAHVTSGDGEGPGDGAGD